MSPAIPATVPEDDRTRIVERPDGYYWQSKDGGREYGPFSTLVETLADMEASEDTSYEPGESLQEAESELGIADWVDPDSGNLAEDSVPHLPDDR